MAPFILQSALALNAIQYGRAALMVGIAYVIGNSINTYLVRKFDSIRLIIVGFIIVILGALSLFIITKYIALNLWTVLLPICIAIAGTGLVFPNSMSGALSIFPQKAGLASSLISCLSLLGCSLVSAVASYLKVYNALPLAYMFLALGIAGSLMYLVAVSTTNEPKDSTT
jgi:DHA1 family 2-module integral membrane pump EmrD-like MFS transporter